MAIEKHRLHAREQRVAAIQVTPARLDHAHLRVGEEMDRLLQEIGMRDEVGIENTDEITLSRKRARSPGAGLEPGAIGRGGSTPR